MKHFIAISLLASWSVFGAEPVRPAVHRNDGVRVQQRAARPHTVVRRRSKKKSAAIIGGSAAGGAAIGALAGGGKGAAIGALAGGGGGAIYDRSTHKKTVVVR